MGALDDKQLASFDNQGFLFLPGLLSEAETAVLRAGAARVMARTAMTKRSGGSGGILF